MVLVDTNILLRSHPSDPSYAVVDAALTKLKHKEEALCIAPQNLIEFWAVATRAHQENGMGMNVSIAAKEIGKLLRLFRVLPYTPQVLEAWRRIVTGKQTHDAHIVAIMEVYAVESILTFKDVHFRRY